MSSPTEAFDLPISFTEFGLDLKFPTLDLDDVTAWCKELTDVRKPIKLKLVPGNTPPVERYRILRSVEFEEEGVDAVADLLYLAAGVKKCLTVSLKKTGMSDADVAATLRKIPTGRAQKLAMDVSGLFEKRQLIPPATPPQQQQQGGASPLAGSSDGAEATSTSPTGDGLDSSSPSTSASPSAA